MALSRPTFKAPAFQHDSQPQSGLQCIVTLSKVMKDAAAHAQLIGMAHTLIRNSETMEELGYTMKAPRKLTMAVKSLDEGVYTHLLNKVAKLIRSRAVTEFDPLGISAHWSGNPLLGGPVYYGDHRLCDEVWPVDPEDNPLLDGPVYWASKNYALALALL